MWRGEGIRESTRISANHKKGKTLKKIGIVGAGLVGSCFKGLDDFEVVHHGEWKDAVWNWRGIVNAAGIIGIGPCQEASHDELIRANVKLAVDMEGYAAKIGIPFLTFSTTAVYRRPGDLEERCREDAPLYPYNAYGASKILMEASLPKDACFIFRLPRVDTETDSEKDFGPKLKNWKVVEHVYQSFVYRDEIIDSVRNAMNNQTHFYGIYNIASKDVYLPEYVKRKYGWKGEVVPAHSLALSPAVMVDTTKAKEVGLL